MQSEKRAVLGQTIALQLEAAIIAGQIAAGTRLDESTLADQFAVSRTPVREALQILAARSLATRHPYRGTVVTQITRLRINELFEAMGEIEALCGRFAAERMGIDERARLETLHEEMILLVEARDLASYEQANTEFHRMIYQGARNSEFCSLAEAMRLKLAPFRRRQLDDEVRMRRSHAEHGQIVDAVLQRNGTGAERALRRHLTSAAKAMLVHWRDGTTDNPAPPTASVPPSGQTSGKTSA